MGHRPAHVAAPDGPDPSRRGELLAADRAPAADAGRSRGRCCQLPGTGRDGRRVPAELRRVAGAAQQHLQLRQPADLGRPQDRVRARRLGQGRGPRPGGHLRVPVRRASQSGRDEEAGNLLHALGISDGDFIAVIDADFAVRPDFLQETMPYFSDPKIGIVQTAQCFDVTNESFSYIQRYAGTLQEIFFRFIQPARDRYKAAICAGTNLVYRRAAVDAAGGFAEVPIGEDVHTGVKLWWAGYETRYLQLCLARGVAPTDFASLANQQARWCRSSMLLMIEKHFLEAPFTWKQRIAFWAAFLYYMSSAALLITAPLPTLTWSGSSRSGCSRTITCRYCPRSRRPSLCFPCSAEAGGPRFTGCA